jgi:integrase
MARPKSYRAGEKGRNRVRLYPHERDGTLMLQYWDEHGKPKRISLRHTDWDQGKNAADVLAAELAKSEGPRTSDLTLRSLFDIYDRRVGIKKTRPKRAHDFRARELFMRCWGADTKVADLDVNHWNAFIQRRREGSLRPPLSRKVDGVLDRMIEYDLKFLLAVLHWAELVVDRKKPLLERNPFRGASSSSRKSAAFQVPKERSPNRPQVSDEEWRSMREAARRIGGHVELFFLVATVTGHRGNAIRQLRWSDVDFDADEMNWNAASDKERKAHQSPLTTEAMEQLRRERKHAGAIGQALMFPGSDDPTAPLPRYTVISMWKGLERRAGIRRVKGRGWHCLRRKLVNDARRAGLDLSVVAEIGGWSGTKTLTEVYVQPDKELGRKAANALAKMRESA